MSGSPVATGGKRSAWMMHVKKTMRANRGLSLKQALQKAADSYKKVARKSKRGGGAGSGGPGASTAASVTGGRRRRGSRKTRRS